MSFDTVQELTSIIGEKELYEVVFPDTTEYYTTSRSSITIPDASPLNGSGSDITYVPVPATRDSVKSSHRGTGRATRILLPVSNSKFQQTLIDGGLGPVMLKVTRGFGDPVANPENFQKDWYIGILQELQVRQKVVVASFQSGEYLFDLVIVPRIACTRLCQHEVYSDNGNGEFGEKIAACGLLEGNFSYDFTVDAINNNGAEIEVSPDLPGPSEYDRFDIPADPVNATEAITGHYTLGRIGYENQTPSNATTMIVLHGYNSVLDRAIFSLHTPLPDLAVIPSGNQTNRVTAVWGCDHKPTTCSTKFFNFDNYLGNHRMPVEDPVRNPTFSFQ